jgi:repressor LexA
VTAISTRQREILTFIREFTKSKGYPPTVREIGEGVGITAPSTVHAHLAALQAAGHLSREENKPRALTITEEDG